MKNLNRGFLTVEAIVATAIFATVITAAMSVAFGAGVAGTDVNLSNAGLFQTVSLLEGAAASSTGAWGTWSNSTNTNGPYTTTQTATFISYCAQLVKAGSGWTAEQSRAQTIGLETLIVNVASSTEIGGTCSAVPPGVWDNPDSLGSTDVSGADGTGVAAVTISGVTYAIVTADPSSAPKEDFYIASATDPTNPTMVGSINTGKGLNGVAVGGHYAYVIQNDNKEQLQVIDISTPTAPVLVASSTLAGVSGSYPEGRSIAYFNNRVYVGTRETAGPEFHVFDVSTPTSPTEMGSLEVTHNVNAIAVAGNLAYLATSANYAELTMIDVSNPGSMSLPPNYTNTDIMNMKFNAKTTSGGSSDEDGTAVYVLGNTVYLGRERVTGSTKSDLYVLDATSKTNIMEVGKLKLGIQSGTEVSGIVTQGNYAFTITTDSNEPFFIVDVTDPANPTPSSSCGLNFSQVTRGIVYQNDLIFMANRSNDILRIIYDQPSVCS